MSPGTALPPAPLLQSAAEKNPLSSIATPMTMHREEGPGEPVEPAVREPTTAEGTVLAVIRQLLERRGAAGVEITPESQLSAELGLDSLELAELSAVLEDDLGRDPYTAGLVPETVGELLAYYQ